MANAFDNVETAFAQSIAGQTMPRWQRKAMESRNKSGCPTPRKTPKKNVR